MSAITGNHAQLLAVRLELLPRIPDLADTQVPFRAEADVVLKAVRKRLNPSLEIEAFRAEPDHLAKRSASTGATRSRCLKPGGFG